MSVVRKTFVENDIQKIIDKAYGDISLRYGYFAPKEDYTDSGFMPSLIDVNLDVDKRECVYVKYVNAPEWYGICQSIECDSLQAILTDIMKAIKEL